VYFHYATGSKNYEISLFGLKLLAMTVYPTHFSKGDENFSREGFALLPPRGYGLEQDFNMCIFYLNRLCRIV